MARDLIGTYQLTTVHTSQGGEPYPITGKLILTSPDSLRRYYRPRPQGWVRTGEHPVAGIYVPSDGRYPQNMAEVDGEVLYVGCRICPDASPNQYQITWVADSAFGGTWEDLQTGISRAYDNAGRELPNPSGYYCARRVKLDSLPEIPR